MSLLIRYDAGREVLASLGDPPNGIVLTVELDEGIEFAVSGTVQPPPASGRIRVREAADEAFEVVDVEELLDGLEGLDAAKGVWSAVVGVVGAYLRHVATDLEMERLEAAVGLMGVVRDGLLERGWFQEVA